MGVLKVVQDCARGEADTLLVHVYSVAAGADPAGAAAGALLTAGLLLLLLLLQIPHSCAAIAAHTAQLPPPLPSQHSPVVFCSLTSSMNASRSLTALRSRCPRALVWGSYTRQMHFLMESW